MNNRQARAQAAALLSEPFIQKHFGFLFEWPVLLVQFVLVLGFLGYEILKTIPKVEEYNLIVNQQKRELLDRIDVRERSYRGSVGSEEDPEDFYLRGQSHLTEILASYQGGSARTATGQLIKPSENELTHILLEQYFNGQIISWALLIAAVYAYTLGHLIFHKYLCDKLLVWDAVQGDSEGDRLKRKSRRMMLLN